MPGHGQRTHPKGKHFDVIEPTGVAPDCTAAEAIPSPFIRHSGAPQLPGTTNAVEVPFSLSRPSDNRQQPGDHDCSRSNILINISRATKLLGPIWTACGLNPICIRIRFSRPTRSEDGLRRLASAGSPQPARQDFDDPASLKADT